MNTKVLLALLATSNLATAVCTFWYEGCGGGNNADVSCPSFGQCYGLNVGFAKGVSDSAVVDCSFVHGYSQSGNPAYPCGSQVCSQVGYYGDCCNSNNKNVKGVISYKGRLVNKREEEGGNVTAAPDFSPPPSCIQARGLEMSGGMSAASKETGEVVEKQECISIWSVGATLNVDMGDGTYVKIPNTTGKVPTEAEVRAELGRLGHVAGEIERAVESLHRDRVWEEH